MNSDNMLPQFDRAKIKTPVGFFSTLLHLIKVNEECVLPAIVKSYDRRTGIARVRPIADNVADNSENKEVLIPRNEYNVHVVRFFHGGCVVDAPLFAGDTGWLVACDRNCTSAIKANSTILSEDQDDSNPSNEGSKRPDDNSLKSFAWGFFIPDSWGNTGISNSDGLIIKGKSISAESTDGSVGVKGELVEIKADNEIVINSNDGGVHISAGENKKIEIGKGHIRATFGNYSVRLSEGSAVLSGKDDSISISDSGIHFHGPIDIKKSIITDIRYDQSLRQMQKKTVLAGIRGDFIVSVGEETDWIKIDGGQAVPEEPCRH